MAEAACYVFRAMTTITTTTTTTTSTTTQTKTCSFPTSSGNTKRNSSTSLPRKESVAVVAPPRPPPPELPPVLGFPRRHATAAKRRRMEAAALLEEEVRGQENRDLEDVFALLDSLCSQEDEEGDTHPLAPTFSTTLPRLPIGDAHGASSWMFASSSAEAQVQMHYALQTTPSPRDVIPPLMSSLSPRSSGMQVAAVATQTEGQPYKRKRPTQQELNAQEMAALRREHHVQLQALRDENSRLRCLLHQELTAHRQHIDNLTEKHQRQLDTHKEQATQLRIQVALLQQEKELRTRRLHAQRTSTSVNK